MKALLISALLLLASTPLFAAIDYKPALRVVVETLPHKAGVEADVSALFAPLKPESTTVTKELDAFVAIVVPKKGKKLRESEFRKCLNDSSFEFVSCTEHEVDPNGELKAPQISSKDLGRLSWNELIVVGRTWVVQVTTGNDVADNVTHERWKVTAVDEKGADVEVTTLDKDGKYIMAGNKPLASPKRLEPPVIEEAETANLETSFGKLATQCTTEETVAANGTCKDETILTSWYTKGAGFLLRETSTWRIIPSKMKFEVSGQHSDRQVIEMTE